MSSVTSVLAQPSGYFVQPATARPLNHRTLNVYMTEQRIERAKKLLSETGLRIADIAPRTGFASQSHFTSTFRKLVWTTPKAFRDTR
jgi:AraC-like DNA-binding protein